MSEKTWRDADHPSYCGRLTYTCRGCRKRCTKSAWGAWCYTCNVKRMTRLNQNIADLARRIGDEKTARKLESDAFKGNN